MDRKRLAVRAVAVLQAGVALVALAGAFELARLGWSPQLTRDPSTRQALRGIRAGAVAAGALGATFALAAVGLWRRRRWGRWLAWVLNLLLAVAILYDPIFEREQPDAKDIALLAAALVTVVVLLLPGVAAQFNPAAKRVAA